MPTRQVVIEGREWKVYPSGFLTANIGDEFGLIFVSTVNGDRDIRVTRYSPTGTQSREQSLASLDDAELMALFRMSQPGERSPEAGYHS
jgi:hypothetical protein